jgi:hypothetical protein
MRWAIAEVLAGLELHWPRLTDRPRPAPKTDEEVTALDHLAQELATRAIAAFLARLEMEEGPEREGDR